MNEPREIRIGDREREAAIGALGEHYVAGRITKEEYDERSGVAWQARTSSDLAPLFYDLPSLQAPARTGSPAPFPAGTRQQHGRRSKPPLLPVLLLALVVVAVLNLAPWPLLVVLVILWIKLAAFRSAGRRR